VASFPHHTRRIVIEILKLGGWMMAPLVICSILSLAIVFERLWSLRTSQVMPAEVIPEIYRLHREGHLDDRSLRMIRTGSPLGTVLAAALSNQSQGREQMRDAVEHAGRQVVHELERYLNTLGTIASISPYLGLLGSVLGMMTVFSSFSSAGAQGAVQNPALLAGGISEILMSTATGLTVAIPSLIFYRFLRGRIAEITVRMEEEAMILIDSIQPEVSRTPAP
jgi:biopolymer transport protein ExbB